jgi:hypothetical protein
MLKITTRTGVTETIFIEEVSNFEQVVGVYRPVLVDNAHVGAA